MVSFVLSLLMFSCSITILGLGSFLVSVLLVLYIYVLPQSSINRFVLTIYGTSNCKWTFTNYVVWTWYYMLVDSCLYSLCSEWDSVGLW